MGQDTEFIKMYKKLKLDKVDDTMLLKWIESGTIDSWLAIYTFGARKETRIGDALVKFLGMDLGKDYSLITECIISPKTVSIIYALGLIGYKKAVTALTKMLQILSDQEMDDYKWIIAWALGEIGDKKALKPLRDALEKDNFEQYWSIGDPMNGGWQSWLLMNDIQYKQERTLFEGGPLPKMPDDFLNDIELAFLSHVQNARSDFINEMVSPIKKAIKKITSADKKVSTENKAKTTKKSTKKK